MPEEPAPQPAPNPAPPAAPAPAPEPTIPRPSATVQAFQSGGGPPVAPPPKTSTKGKVVFAIWLVLIFAVMVGGWYWFIFQHNNLPLINR